ncbi:MAG: hypothetical protein GY795_05015 [Desulfobacterales bacterium]|nr:hypothetical protein [Desulfobacterales bacterium]
MPKFHFGTPVFRINQDGNRLSNLAGENLQGFGNLEGLSIPKFHFGLLCRNCKNFRKQQNKAGISVQAARLSFV